MSCFPVHKIGFGAMFNWSDMRFFLELARLRHLSATATRMRVDTSTVSRRIAELERSLHAKLFERAAEGFFLTEDGQKVFAYAEKMETTAADISFALTGGATGNSGIVRVATMEGFATLVIASQWGLLRKSHPQIALELLVVSQPTNLGRREAIGA
jgi:DNA-binding transcriptional LysR family regulator